MPFILGGKFVLTTVVNSVKGKGTISLSKNLQYGRICHAELVSASNKINELWGDMELLRIDCETKTPEIRIKRKT